MSIYKKMTDHVLEHMEEITQQQADRTAQLIIDIHLTPELIHETASIVIDQDK